MITLSCLRFEIVSHFSAQSVGSYSLFVAEFRLVHIITGVFCDWRTTSNGFLLSNSCNFVVFKEDQLPSSSNLIFQVLALSMKKTWWDHCWKIVYFSTLSLYVFSFKAEKLVLSSHFRSLNNSRHWRNLEMPSLKCFKRGFKSSQYSRFSIKTTAVFTREMYVAIHWQVHLWMSLFLISVFWCP